MSKPFNHLLNKYLLNAYHVRGIITSVKTALQDAGNMVFRINEKLEHLHLLGKLQSPLWHEKIYWSTFQSNAYMLIVVELCCQKDTQLLTSSTRECDCIWK